MTSKSVEGYSLSGLGKQVFCIIRVGTQVQHLREEKKMSTLHSLNQLIIKTHTIYSQSIHTASRFERVSQK